MKRHLAIAVVSLLLIGVATASATTYVPMSDPDLADQAAAIARVTVVGVEPGPADRIPSTEYLVEVDEIVQGYLPASTVVVRVPGGERADGVGLKIWGAPELQPGEEAVLFLQPAADGTYGILHLMLGAFHSREAHGFKLAEQDLAEAHRLGSASGEETGVRDLDKFTAWLADRAAGVQREADYWIERPQQDLRTHEKAHTLLPTTDNIPIRWFHFDSGKSVSWSVHSAGQPGLEMGQTIASFQAALAAWTNDPTSNIQYVYGGTTGATGGLKGMDKVNAILFNDPGNVHIPGTYSCDKGGVVAAGGPYYYPGSRSYRGQTYHEAAEADVVTNDGAECLLRDNPLGAEEVFAHELGHTLGFGHASDSQALMWSRAHNDGRGCRLSNDDRMAASMVYGDGSFQPETPPPPAALMLEAVPAKTQIALSWNSPFTGIESFRVESQQGKGTFRTLLTVPGSDAAATVGGLKPNKAYTLRLTAVRPDGTVAGSSEVVKVRTTKK